MMKQLNIQSIRFSDGLGYGDGTISGTCNEDSHLLQQIDEVIQSPAILVAVDRDDDDRLITDDGCGDGREVGSVLRSGFPLKRSLHRAKVFGGGVTMAAAISIGLGEGRGQTLRTIFNDAIATLKTKNMDFGAHTADHVASDYDSGCGAIDGAPKVVRHITVYRDKIKETILQLGVNYDGLEADLTTILNNFQSLATKAVAEDFCGRDIVQTIAKNGKVIKQLAGPHLEKRIILNRVNGYTVNQNVVRQCSLGCMQVFAVDVWRLEELANKLYVLPSKQRRALVSELVYTLGVAATLTPGDLPVYVIDALPLAVAA